MLLDPQHMIQEIRELLEQPGIDSDQGRPGRVGRGLPRAVSLRAESKNRNVRCLPFLFQLGNDSAGVLGPESQVQQDHERTILGGAGNNLAGIANRFHPVSEILEPIDQLIAQQRILEIAKRERFGHVA